MLLSYQDRLSSNLEARDLFWRSFFWLSVFATTIALDSQVSLRSVAQTVSIGRAAYRIDLPNDPSGQPRRSIKAAPKISQRLKDSGEPVPSNDWCSSLVWPMHSSHSLPMFAHPLAMQAHSDGLGIGYNPLPRVSDRRENGKIVQAGTDYRYSYQESLLVGLKGMRSDNCVLDRYSDWTVTALWRHLQPDSGKSSELRATFGHGLPFVYFKKKGDAPILVRFTGAKVDRSQTPVNPMVFELSGITATCSDEKSKFQLAVDAFQNAGIGSKARLSYDFEGDGRVDRVETFGLMATDPSSESWETYSSDKQPIDPLLTYGEFADFENGTVKFEFWKCFGDGDLRLDLSQCSLNLPIENGRFFLTSGNKLSEHHGAGLAVLDGGENTTQAKVFYRDENVLGVTVNETHYGLFAPAGARWPAGDRLDEATTDLAGKDFFSVAVLPDANSKTIERFEQFAFAFVTDTRVDFHYDPKAAQVVTRFSATTVVEQGDNSQTMFALYRHQHLNLVYPDRLTTDQYESPRGQMKVVSGESFSTSTPFTGVLPSLPCAKGSRQHLNRLLDEFVDQVMSRPEKFEKSDTYWNGKELGKFSEAIQIADQLGRNQQRDQLVELLKSRLEDWFDGKDDLFFYYDQRWNTLIGYPDSYGAAEQLNDHHFHYSYFIRAASIVAQFDPEWVAPENYGGIIELLIRNCANADRTDRRFPWLRFFDPYAGHSWASGHAGFASGNNQESSSESMNFATSLILYGEATNNEEIRDLGIYWYATEAAAIRQYWFDVNGEVFPDRYGFNCVGMIWGDGGTYGTWWTANPEEIHGINFLPLNGGSLYLARDLEYVKRNQQELVESNQDFHTADSGEAERFDRWQDILYEHLALADPIEAEKMYQRLPKDFKSEFGESRLHTFQWISSLKSLGQFDDEVLADHPTAVVFVKAGRKSYVISNFGNGPLQVKFSDGANFTVPTGLHVLSD